MNCKSAKMLISHYIEQDLGAKRHNGLERHLEECAICRRERDRLRKTVHIMQAVEEIDPPRDYLQAIKVFLTKNQGAV